MSDSTGSAPRAKEVPQIKELGPRFFEFLQRLQRPVVFLDLEATGVDHQRDRIIEISLLRIQSDPVSIEAPRTWRVDPQQRIPTEASEIHGIVNEDLVGCPTFPQIAGQIAELLEGADLAGLVFTGAGGPPALPPVPPCRRWISTEQMSVLA